MTKSCQSLRGRGVQMRKQFKRICEIVDFYFEKILSEMEVALRYKQSEHCLCCLHCLHCLHCSNCLKSRVAEVAREHGWHPPKSLDSDENLMLEHMLFCRKLRFVAIYALFGDL